MSKIWNQAILQQYINDQTQESLTLEYKSADALAKSDGKMKEISKDVSAMANSSGGVIIYGIKEYDLAEKRYLPEKITPIMQNAFSKEWLEQVINNIRPRIDGITIHPVPIDTDINHVVYIVEVPQSTTAHQATDWRYYKRYNFQAVPMEDYEVRDTMGRLQHPKFEISFEIDIQSQKYFSQIENTQKTQTNCTLRVFAKNIGGVYAQYVNGFIQVPYPILHDLTIEQIKFRNEKIIEENGNKFYEYYEDNTVRDVVDVDFKLGDPITKYGPSRYEPILPGLTHTWEILIWDKFTQESLDELEIKWVVYADNAAPSQGSIKVSDIKVSDSRKK